MKNDLGYRIFLIATGLAIFVLAIASGIYLGLSMLWGLVSSYMAPSTPAERKDTIQVFVQVLGLGTMLGPVVQFVAALVVLCGLYYTSRTLRLNQEGQFADRFTKATDQLGKKEQLETRLSAIYSLERLALDSDRDYWPVVEVLTAYVRVNARWVPIEGAESRMEREPASQIPADIQAVLTILNRRPDHRRKLEPLPLNLSNTDLRFGDLNIPSAKGVRLESVDFRSCCLVGVGLRDARLCPFNPRSPRPDGDARFEQSWLHKAHLERADLTRAQFDGTMLREAFLNNADLTDADFQAADLRGADLTGAVLARTNFEGADLRDAIGLAQLTQEQIDQTYMDDETRVPPNCKRSRSRKPRT